MGGVTVCVRGRNVRATAIKPVRGAAPDPARDQSLDPSSLRADGPSISEDKPYAPNSALQRLSISRMGSWYGHRVSQTPQPTQSPAFFAMAA